MPTLLKSALSQSALSTLLKYNVSSCLVIFALLQLWRPCFFLTDDNLSGLYPVLVEIGRHMHHGEWPFVSNYLFGGNYDWSRDLGCLCWHPFYLLPALLADTWARLWMIDLVALPYLLTTTIGFTILARNLRDEYNLRLPDILVLFYTMSFVFSMYILMIGPSWISFLGNQSALPWLTLGIMDRKLVRGILVVTMVTIHQFIGSYAGMTLSTSFFFTLFALGIAICRRSPRAFFIWYGGNILAYLALVVLLLRVLDGFGHAARAGGFIPGTAPAYAIPATIFPFSFFFGNWTEPVIKLMGDPTSALLSFPFLSNLLPCAAAWCLISVLLGSAHWRPLEILCLGMAGLIMLFIIRPEFITEAMHSMPLLKSLRWPFREALQFLFFIHLLIILRPPTNQLIGRFTVFYSIALFLLPLPFIRTPSLNLLAVDRQAILSGHADRFWQQVRLLLKPTDQIATIIDRQMWEKDSASIPYSYLGTANFPALFQVPCVSGYSPTSPLDQITLQVRPRYWFGAFEPAQVPALFQERPELKLIVLENVSPLKISLLSQGQPPIDLTPFLSR